MSLSYLLQSMMSDRRTIIASRSLLGVVVAWAVASIMALAFQCSLPSPWDSSRHCVDQVSENCYSARPINSHSQPLLHYTIGAFNIATDVALIILPCVVFWTVHNPMKRLQVVSLFSIRIMYVDEIRISFPTDRAQCDCRNRRPALSCCSAVQTPFRRDL
jgi:hypothetical protein